jgi:hypothetical protein
MTAAGFPPSLERPTVQQSRAEVRRRIWVATAGLFIFYLIVGLALRYPINETKLHVTGDEHHYLTQVLSLLNDGDLVVLNNYENGDYLTVFDGVLDPTLWNLFGESGYSGHSPGAGLAVTPGWWAAGWAGVLATLAATIAAAFSISAATLARILKGRLSTTALLVLMSGFASLPLLAYSHTLYPETFMALLLAVVVWLAVIHHQTPDARRRTLAAAGAISVCGVSMGLHPKYFLVVVFFTLYFVVFDFLEARSSRNKARFGAALSYLAIAALWLTLFSWLHSLMWDTFHPAGWWFTAARSSLGVSPGEATIHLLDLLFGSQNGLLFLVPVTLLAVAFLAWAIHREPDRVVTGLRVQVVLALVSIVGLAAFSADWHAGDSPLARYATPIVPLLLLAAAYVAATRTRTVARLMFISVLAGAALVQVLAYMASPLAFRPRPDGGGGFLAFISARVDALANPWSWFWSAATTNSWAGILWWVIALGLALWLYSRKDVSRVTAPAENGSPEPAVDEAPGRTQL